MLSEVTRAGVTRIIRKELIPAWGHRDPNSIQRPEIQHWAKGIADGKGRKKAAPYLADRAVDYMAMEELCVGDIARVLETRHG